jgi:hypothetical protein
LARVVGEKVIERFFVILLILIDKTAEFVGLDKLSGCDIELRV